MGYYSQLITCTLLLVVVRVVQYELLESAFSRLLLELARGRRQASKKKAGTFMESGYAESPRRRELECIFSDRHG